MSELEVLVGGKPVGSIFRSEREEGSFLFQYARGAEPEDAVSLTMPVVVDPYDSMGTVHPIFEMNLPEGALRHVLELQFSKLIPDFDSLGLLSIVGLSQIGRLRYRSERSADDALPVQSVAELLSYKGAEDLMSSLLSRFAALSGVSGVQPKVLLRDSTLQFDRLTDKGATHLIKSFDPRELPELAANEFFSMRAAHFSGLPTPRLQLSDNRQLLVIERFDRTPAGSYLGFEDFCVLMGLRAGGRYSKSYEELAEMTSVYVSPECRADAMKQLFGAVALACAIKNGDAHLKNFGILYDLPGVHVRLAPVYDMLSTAPYQPNDVLALTLNGTKAYPSRTTLVDYARRSCGLSARQTEQILAQTGQGLQLALQELLTYAEVRSDFQKAATRFREVFEAGIRFVTER